MGGRAGSQGRSKTPSSSDERDLHVKACLIANYLPDGQQSMLRFSELLERELPTVGVAVETLRPDVHLNVRKSARGVGKYLGYVDKFVSFPSELQGYLKGSRRPDIVHICDHSNAMYVRQLRGVPHVVTAHDLLAVRSAYGEFGENRTKWSGKKLQSMILEGLNAAERVVCVSEATRADVLRLTSLRPEQVEVIYNGLNFRYAPMPLDEAHTVLRQLELQLPFILHVGGDHWYKNRRGVLHIYSALRELHRHVPRLLMVGPALSWEQKAIADEGGFSDEVSVISSATNEQLCALYTLAELLLFPSLVEGFGWPILESQACGCPVVTTNRAPMTEVGGSAAAYIDPRQVESSARVVLDLLNEVGTARARRREESLANAGRFSTREMVEGYARIYRELAGKKMFQCAAALS